MSEISIVVEIPDSLYCRTLRVLPGMTVTGLVKLLESRCPVYDETLKSMKHIRISIM